MHLQLPTVGLLTWTCMRQCVRLFEDDQLVYLMVAKVVPFVLWTEVHLAILSHEFGVE
jgi:hypothetical protein